MKINLDEKDIKFLERLKSNREDHHMLFSKKEEGKNFSIEFEIKDADLATLFIQTLLFDRNGDLQRNTGIHVKKLSFIPERERLENIHQYITNALQELEAVKEYL